MQPCSFDFQYGTPHTIECLSGRRIHMPGVNAGVAPAPGTPAPSASQAPTAPQPVNGSNPDIAARNRQNAPEVHRHHPRPIDPIMEGPLLAAHYQMMAVLRNFAHSYARNMAEHAQRRDAVLGSSLAGHANPSRTQNQSSKPAALVPDGDNSKAAVIANNTAESGSGSSHSPKHKKQKLSKNHAEGAGGGSTA